LEEGLSILEDALYTLEDVLFVLAEGLYISEDALYTLENVFINLLFNLTATHIKVFIADFSFGKSLKYLQMAKYHYK
jgi:hypothetical protein